MEGGEVKMCHKILIFYDTMEFGRNHECVCV